MGESTVAKPTSNDIAMVIQIHPASDWKCELFGLGPHGIIVIPGKGNEPNFFWRWMQYLIFGNRWVRR